MIDFNELKGYIRDNYDEVSIILESARLSILNAPEIKILHGKYLIDFWKERPNRKLTYVLFFEEATIAELDFNNIKLNLNTSINETLKTHNVIKVGKEFNILEKNALETNIEFILDLSDNRNVVFFFGEEGIEVAIRGKIVDKINFFYNESDRLMFQKKHHISNLQACLKEYEVFIKEPGNNEAFFASRRLVRRLKPKDTPNNILHNKPEKILRDNLLSFLNRNTQHSFSKENELNNQRELDLYTEVEGKKYLIEVKWLGQTVNDGESDLTHKVTDYSARDGVTQTLEYIKHLLEEMNFNLHCGYLCVFDAREKKKTIKYQNFDFVREELLPYFKHHFIKLDEISLDRNN